MRITSKQIAELAGVSRGTVDRALNRRGGVKPEVQQRIEELAREYGYRPNRAGKALVMRDTLHLGVILPSAGNPFFDEIKRGLQAAQADFSDFPVVLHWQEAKGYHLERQLAQIEAAGEMAGLIITPLNHPLVAERLNAFMQAGDRPVVTLNTDVADCARLAYVGCHYRESGQTAAQLMGLLTGGKARILIVTGSHEVLGHTQRIGGFTQVLRDEFPCAAIAAVVENKDDDALSAETVKQALTADPAIDAVYFCAAGVAGGVQAALDTAARPLTILTCDTTPAVCRLVREGAIQATIDQQPYWQGYTAMKTLLERLLFQTAPAETCLYAHNEIRVKYNL